MSPANLGKECASALQAAGRPGHRQPLFGPHQDLRSCKASGQRSEKTQGRFVAPRASQYVAEGSCRTVREICGQQDIAPDQLIKS